ncbi:MAG: class I SAM-dependent methyltransferase [Planctomycetes bacterium]|nr:class I SAM-dependent methyltransferase [Planctomycetota bacterium]
MIEPFGAVYADAYDALYADKDYDGECDLIERLFDRYTQRRVCDILDLGCGTGGHALRLARRGYRVLGVDRSASMIAQARNKAARSDDAARLEFARADLRRFRAERRFDAALMMFAVLGYQLEDADVHDALTTARVHLRPGGLLLFDCWYAPAVLHLRPTDRVKTADTPQGRLTRTTSAELDIARHRCTVRFQVCGEGTARPAPTEETHCVRYFDAGELESLLHGCGFATLHIGATDEFDRKPDETTWNVFVVARAVATAPP